jgi:AcrR family transcriptional regulator
MPKADAQMPGRASDRREERRTTRARLVGAAVTAISQHGWDRVTTRQVAMLAGVNPGLVHYHFASMDALRREAVLEALAREVGAPTAALVQAPSIEDGLRQCLIAVGELDPRSESALVLSEAMLASTRDAELRTTLQQALVEFRGVLAARIAREDGVDPDGAAMTVAAALDGVFLHRLVEPDLDVSRLAAPLVAALRLPSRPSANRTLRP